MSCSMPRAGGLFFAALLFTLGAVGAGELYRPVPSDAQVTRFTRFNIRYQLRDIVADGVQKVEFYITEDMGRTWRLYGEDPDRMSPMTVEVPGEGVYGFVCIATDRFGNREREPGPRTRPETVIVVDRTPPTAKWLAPTQNALGRSRAIELAWEASDPNFGNAPVKLQYAVDARSNHDRDAVWNTLQENLSASGSINWTPPTDSSARYNFRLVAEDRAGNMAVAYNAATVTLDTNPPLIASVSPLRSNKLENDIVVEADDGPSGSGVKEISLYTTDNGGATWTLVKETNENGESVPLKRKPGQSIAYAARASGDHGLWPVVFDEAGNATPLPTIGVVGPFVLVIDTESPNVSLSNSFLMGRSAVLVSDSRLVQWTAYDPHILNNSAAISLSLDNGSTWQELRAGLPTSGSESITFPFGSQSEEAKLKVTVSDEFGNVGEGISETFKLSRADTTIDAVTPVGSAMGSAPTTGSGFDSGLWGDDPGTPPTIPPPGPSPTPDGFMVTHPPQTGLTPDYPYPSLGETPQDSYSPIGGPLPTGPTDVYQLPPSSPTSPTGPGGYYPPMPGVTFGEPRGESHASSLPHAMTGAPQPPSQSSGAGLPVPPTQSLPPTPSAPVWTPSPGAGSTPPAPVAPSIPTPTSPPSAAGQGDSTWAPPPAWPDEQPATGQTGSGSMWETAPPAPIESTTPSLPSVPSVPTDSFGSDPTGLMPPSLSSAGGDLSMPALPPLDSGSLFDSQGLPEMPALPGAQDTAVSSPPTTPIPTPASPSAPSVPTPTPMPMPPPTDSVDTGVPTLPQPGSQISTLPDMDDIAPPRPLDAPGSQRMANPRQLSDHYAAESTTYLTDGNTSLARESAQKALEADDNNPRALMALSQVYAQDVPDVNNFAAAANIAKKATELGRDWEAWWNCADVFYRWAHKRNTELLEMARRQQNQPLELIDERNQALSNAKIAIGNSASLVQGQGEAERKKVANSQGLIAYLDARTIPESAPDYRVRAVPLLLEAVTPFQNAMRLSSRPTYSETFHLGIIYFRLAALERDSGNASQAQQHYLDAIRYLEEATTTMDTPAGGPREAYYMLANCYDNLAEQPGQNRTRYKELALRYWRQTADFYSAGTAYRDYAETRIDVLSQELGQ